MNEEGQQPNEEETKPAAGEANAPEGAMAETSTEDIQEMYEDLGIKATAPSGKPKGRPKTADVRDKDIPKKDAKDSKDGKQKDDDSKSKSKDAPDNGEDVVAGNEADKKGKKVSKDDGKVSDKPEKPDEGVRDPKSKTKEDSERGSKEDTSGGDDGDGQGADKSADAKGKENEEGKRPGKSNPEVEKRFQKLTGDVKERDEVIAELQQKLQNSTKQQVESQISQEDPEYTLDDFKKVRDEYGEVLNLDDDQAELAYRRWQEGYNQRATEREAKVNFETARQEKAEAHTRQVMQDSADAYDTLAGLMDDYPELVSTSDKFDSDFAAEAMPIIEEAVQYQEGTEPGNKEGKLPVIIGLKINPKKILEAMRGISNKKRNLPLNSLNDNVETGSNVSVPHGRSSDPNVNAANDLYKQLGIKKRV